MRNTLAAILFGTFIGQAFAQGTDVGLVNLVSGDVGYAAPTGSPGKAQPFMKVREGDRFNVPAGAQIRIVYFTSARQERWVGPSSFRAAKGASEVLSGKPAETSVLPASVPDRIARVPDLMQNARLGGIQVRGPARLSQLSAAEQESVKEARATFNKLRADLPADDITPELFLVAALSEHLLYDQIKPLVDDMLRRQPDNADLKVLDAWIAQRLAR